MNLTRFASQIRMQTPANNANSARLVFLSRLGSSLAVWAVALYIIFSGYEIGFFLLIATIGMIGLWEFYTMLDHKHLPNFKITGMICGAAFICGSFFYYSRASRLESYEFEAAVLLFFMFVVFARQMFQKTRDISPIETMAYSTCSGSLISSRRSSMSSPTRRAA